MKRPAKATKMFGNNMFVQGQITRKANKLDLTRQTIGIEKEQKRASSEPDL